ncbi:unnamed protein product [Clonostachys chloroleuca]|uniref:Cytochrome b5 heme-binding domain-containing protein n=1 Tax=Clonostachys chloroleuca TaxID=1926264 RepID=A0AA35PVS9_9HYPO|nr:unnamed protein product [Clonostachys chloroleuca]
MTEKRREFSAAELATLSSRNNLHLLISGKVYDVHEFLHDHPGGDLVLLGEGGKDATKAFEDIQHTDDAKELMEELLVGYQTGERITTQEPKQIQIERKTAISRKKEHEDY